MTLSPALPATALAQPVARPVLMPQVPVLLARHQKALFLSHDGEIEELPADQLKGRLSLTPLVCHAPSTAARLGTSAFMAFDVLELFAFVHPAQFMVPHAHGLADFYHLKRAQTWEDEAFILLEATRNLLTDLQTGAAYNAEQAKLIVLGMKEWIWTPFVADALGVDLGTPEQVGGLKVWRDLSEWSDHAPSAPPGQDALTPQEALGNLARMLDGIKAEKRAEQITYTQNLTPAFGPKQAEDAPTIVMAEAGTGTGKTLGYIANAQSWAQKNTGQVWVSTYTKNLQRQIATELEKAYDNPTEKRLKTVVRKGRENYLCLLNFEDLIKSASLPGQKKIKVSAGLLARWVSATENGDLKGGDFPGWLSELLGFGLVSALSDQRGECIHAACPHYNKCFIEKNIRRSKQAELVVANHALVMVQNALAGEFLEDTTALPTRYVFDEAHHLFDAADGAFAAHLTGRESLEMRRWIVGNEQAKGFRTGRMRGLKTRMDELIPFDDALLHHLQAILMGSRALASNGWLDRLQANNPSGAMEDFLGAVMRFVTTRAEGQDTVYSLEATKDSIPADLMIAAEQLTEALRPIKHAAEKICGLCETHLTEKQDQLETRDKQKIEGLIKSLHKRLILPLEAWLDMLAHLAQPTPDCFLDWFMIERIEGHTLDVGFYRHWVDPMMPFMQSLEKQAHGIVFTSATLTEGADDETENRDNAETFLGLPHRANQAAPSWVEVQSPFDYAAQSKILIVNDLDTRQIGHVAKAYEALFKAAGGGGLGLFTSIQKLKAVHERLVPSLEALDIPLYAQHMDSMDITTLLDIFRAEDDACLLGTDAIRDGVDVPGRSLRLLVFDKVPWPRPNLLHKARRDVFGSKLYDERLTRLKLKQAYGRLIRTNTDKGVFVMLESRLPTRLCSAFPKDVPIERIGLKQAVEQIEAFF